MFDLGWSELLFIGIVALIVVGPKDLPRMFREIGRFTGKARAMARDFSRAMNAAADEAGVKDLDRTLRAATNPMRSATSAMRDAVNLKDTDSKSTKATAGTKSTEKPAATDEPPPDEAAADAGVADAVADAGVAEEAAAPPKPKPARKAAPKKAAPKPPAPKPAADPAPAAADSADGTSA